MSYICGTPKGRRRTLIIRDHVECGSKIRVESLIDESLEILVIIVSLRIMVELFEYFLIKAMR